MSYFFSEGARVEHLEHVAYYEEQRPGLGVRYLAAFESAMVEVCENPDRFRVELPPGIRRHRVPGFPYTFSIASRARGLKCWWSRLIGDGRAIGWAGFNGSFHWHACGAL